MIRQDLKQNFTSTKKKIIVFIIMLLLGQFVFVLITVYQNQEVLSNYRDHMDRYSDLNALQRDLNNMDYYLNQYIEKEDIQHLANFNQHVDTYQKSFNTLEAVGTTNEERLLLRAISNTYISYYEACNTAIIKKRCGEGDYFKWLQKSKRIRQYLDLYLQQLLEAMVKQGQRGHQNLSEKANLIKMLSLGGNISMILISIIIGLAYVKKITTPLSHLVEGTKKMAEGELDIEEIELPEDMELRSLATAFNIMNKNIRRLITDLKEKAELERLLEQSRFLALQCQINPHFLFNTLNTISRAIRLTSQEKAVELIGALATILRYSLKEGEYLASIDEELTTIKNYIFIQQFRFGERMQFNIDIEEGIDVASIYIPKFTLQPLVENAIIHGIEPKEEGGVLRVHVFHSLHKANKGLGIIVEDNGDGIEQRRLEAIKNKQANREMGHTTGIGLSNVWNRWIIMTGEDDSFNIDSRWNQGTRVTMNLSNKRIREMKEGGPYASNTNCG